MNLTTAREGELKQVFDTLEEAFGELDIDYYLIGAIARDIWYAKEKKQSRLTRDVDFAVLVGSQQEYTAIRQYLTENKNFVAIKCNAFVLLTPTGIEIDILPFGEIDVEDQVTLQGPGLANIKVNGFLEVYESGTETMELATGHQFKIATLPSIVLLKLIAFDDRPEERPKEPGDIAMILTYYFDLQANFIYREYADLFLNNSPEWEEMKLPEISAIVIGREIKRITRENESLRVRLIKILQTQIKQEENSAFIRGMVKQTAETMEDVIKWLMRLQEGIAK